MNQYLKNIFSVFIFTALLAVPAWADPPLPEAITAPEGVVPVAADKAASGPPVQTDIIETDHGTQESTKQLHYYNYADDEAEYSVSLPDAPTVSTIWEESPETKAFLKAYPSDHAALGEQAIYKLVDMDTEEMFDVKIIFLRASPAFLESLDEQKIKRMLQKKFKEVSLSNETFNISNGTSTLKWAQLTGFVLDNHHHPAFCAIHYLTGQQSILVVQVRYSLENKHFQEYYNHMVNNIKYVQP